MNKKGIKKRGQFSREFLNCFFKTLTCNLPQRRHLSHPTQSIIREMFLKWSRNSTLSLGVWSLVPEKSAPSSKWSGKDLWTKFFIKLDWKFAKLQTISTFFWDLDNLKINFNFSSAHFYLLNLLSHRHVGKFKTFVALRRSRSCKFQLDPAIFTHFSDIIFFAIPFEPFGANDPRGSQQARGDAYNTIIFTHARKLWLEVRTIPFPPSI